MELRTSLLANRSHPGEVYINLFSSNDGNGDDTKVSLENEISFFSQNFRHIYSNVIGAPMSYESNLVSAITECMFIIIIKQQHVCESCKNKLVKHPLAAR